MYPKKSKPFNNIDEINLNYEFEKENWLNKSQENSEKKYLEKLYFDYLDYKLPLNETKLIVYEKKMGISIKSEYSLENIVKLFIQQITEYIKFANKRRWYYERHALNKIHWEHFIISDDRFPNLIKVSYKNMNDETFNFFKSKLMTSANSINDNFRFTGSSREFVEDFSFLQDNFIHFDFKGFYTLYKDRQEVFKWIESKLNLNKENPNKIKKVLTTPQKIKVIDKLNIIDYLMSSKGFSKTNAEKLLGYLFEISPKQVKNNLSNRIHEEYISNLIDEVKNQPSKN